ncbi:MAG: hypothetical protein ACFB2W_00695 [Leptolyngbyaceae cyanobacterium]
MSVESDLISLSPDHLIMMDGAAIDIGVGPSAPKALVAQNAVDFGGPPCCRDVSASFRPLSGNSRLELEDSNEINTSPQAQRVIGGWIRTPADYNARIIAGIYKEGSGGTYFAISIFPTGSVVLLVGENNTFEIQARPGIFLEEDRSYHFLMLFDGDGGSNRFNAYVDGVPAPRYSPANPQPNITQHSSHGGDIVFGDPDTNIQYGGEPINLDGPTGISFNAWFFRRNLLTDAQIREFVFERQALPDTVIVADTVTSMQSSLDMLSNTTRRNAALSIEIQQATNASDFTLNVASILFDENCSIEIQFSGSANTLTLTQSGATNLDLTKASAPFGGSITIQPPPVTTIISGVPTASNENGIAPAPAIGLYNGADDSFIAALDTADAEYNNDGSWTVPLTNYLASGTIKIAGEALGWYRTPFFSVDLASPPTVLAIDSGFEEIADENGNALTGLGVPAAINRLIYDQLNTRFEVAPGGLDFFSAIDKFDQLTSGKTGLEDFNTSVVRGIRFVSNKYGREVQLPAPLTAAATEGAATSPTLTDFLILRSGDPSADLFEHGLASTAPGLSTRPEVRLQSTRFISGSDGSSGGTTPADNYNYFTENNRADAFKANVSSIPTNPLRVDDERLDNLDVAISSRSSHTTPDLSNLDVAVSSRLATNNYTAPDNSGIAAIPTNPVLATDNRLSTLDVAISTRLAADSYNAPLDSTAIQSAAAAALNSYDPPTRTELADDIASIIAQGDSAWTTATEVVATNMRGTDRALTSIDLSNLALETTAQACLSAATALADGRYIEQYTNPPATGTQYNADGTIRQVFDIFQADGTTTATGPENAAERRPRS